MHRKCHADALQALSYVVMTLSGKVLVPAGKTLHSMILHLYQDRYYNSVVGMAKAIDYGAEVQDPLHLSQP